MEFYAFDAEYVRRLCAHEAEFEEHFTAYFGELMLIKLRKRRVPAADIPDLIQDTFVRAFSQLCITNSLRRPESLGAFVNSICNNVWREYLRNRRLEPLPDDVAERGGEENPENDLITAERQRAVQRALGELAERERRLLHDVFFDEQSKDEVSRKLGINSDYLRVRVFRAKKLFKRRFLKKDH